MVFGGNSSTAIIDNTTASCVETNLRGANGTHLANVESMVLFDEMAFQLFRLTLVDEYDLKVSSCICTCASGLDSWVLYPIKNGEHNSESASTISHGMKN